MVPASQAKPPPAKPHIKQPAPRPGQKPRAPLRPAEVRALADADRRYKKAKREFEAAKMEREQLVYKALPKVKLGQWVKGAGWVIRITMQNSGQRFSLVDYLKEYRLTSAMRKYVSDGTDSPRLTVEPEK